MSLYESGHRAVARYMRARHGYLAPASRGRVRCTLGESVVFGEIYSDHGGWIQVLVEGQTLVALSVGMTGWTVKDS